MGGVKLLFFPHGWGNEYPTPSTQPPPPHPTYASGNFWERPRNQYKAPTAFISLLFDTQVPIFRRKSIWGGIKLSANQIVVDKGSFFTCEVEIIVIILYVSPDLNSTASCWFYFGSYRLPLLVHDFRRHRAGQHVTVLQPQGLCPSSRTLGVSFMGAINSR